MSIFNSRSLNVAAILLPLAASAPAFAADALGTRKNPLKLSMVPSNDARKIESNMQPIARCLEKETGYFFETSVPSSYVVVVESLGSKKIDVAFFNPFGYVVARDRFGVEAILRPVRQGDGNYKGQILVRADLKAKTLKDLNGKKFAYVDPASTSGHILSKKALMDAGAKPSEEVFAGKHDSVVTMIYQGQVDAGATYHSPTGADGKIRDARERVLTQFPDVEKKVKILALTEEVPTDPVVVRKDLDAAMKAKLKSAFLACVKSNKDAFMGMMNAEGLMEVSDKDYDGLRKAISAVGIDAETQLAPVKK